MNRQPVILERDLDAVVTIDGRLVPGFVYETRRCAGCRQHLVFHLGHQASFCPCCNRWLDLHCDDPACYYCVGRADPPLA
jgi:hypothetical protein